MDGLIFLLICIAVGLLLGGTALWAWHWANRLDAELTAYVAAGSMEPDTAKAILGTKATTARKREIAALIAEGMEPAKGLSLLESMSAA